MGGFLVNQLRSMLRSSPAPANADVTDADLEFERRLLGEDAPFPRLYPGIASRIATAGPGAMPGVEPGSSINDLASGDLPEVARPWGIPPPGPSIRPPSVEEQVAEEQTMAAAAVPKRAPIRAVRMPNGKLVYTNRTSNDPEAEQGAEVPMADAARSSRVSLGSLDPTSRTMSALVRAAAMENKGDGAEIGGGLSVIEGTPQQQRQLKFEDALGAAALAKAQGSLEYEEMSPQAQADLRNPDIGLFSFILSQMKPEIDRIGAETDAAIAKTTDPAIRATLEQKRADRIADIYKRILAAQRVPTS